MESVAGEALEAVREHAAVSEVLWCAPTWGSVVAVSPRTPSAAPPSEILELKALSRVP